jgi:hypothetical protein
LKPLRFEGVEALGEDWSRLSVPQNGCRPRDDYPTRRPGLHGACGWSRPASPGGGRLRGRVSCDGQGEGEGRAAVGVRGGPEPPPVRFDDGAAAQVALPVLVMAPQRMRGPLESSREMTPQYAISWRGRCPAEPATRQ